METLAEREQRVAALEAGRRARRTESRSLTPSNRRQFIGGAEVGAMSPRRAMAISAVYSAINLYVQTISTLPAEVFARRGERRERVRSGRTVELL